MSQRFQTRCAAGVAGWAVLAAALALQEHAAGQWVLEEDFPVQPGQFGGSVAVSGDVAIVGTEEADNVGAAYVYRRASDGSWALEDELLANDGMVDDFFGEAVAVSGDLALIGAPGRDQTAEDSGAVYFFLRSGGTWSFEQKLVPISGGPGGGASAGFGSAITISGDSAIIGAAGDSTRGVFAGAAYAFRRQSNGTWIQEAKLLASDGGAEDAFGVSVGVQGNWALVGAPFEDEGGPDSGAVYVFKRNNSGAWPQRTKLKRPNGNAFEFFGWSVAVSGQNAIVGAPLDTVGAAEGSATIYLRSGTTWAKVKRLRATDPTPFELFGFAVAISGDTAIVGGPDNLLETDPGAVYTFRQNENGSWPSIGDSVLTAPGSAEVDYFGESVAISDDIAVVGAPADGSFDGAAYAFRDDRPVAPVVGSLVVSPDPMAAGQVLSLTAADVTDVNGTDSVALVRFYRDSDASGSWEDTDQVLATDTTPGDGWAWLGFVSGSWPPGPNTFFARAQDDGGLWSGAAQATSTVWAEPGGDSPPAPPAYDTAPAGNTDMVVLVHGWNTTQAQYDNFWTPLAAEVLGVIPGAAGWSVWAYNWTLLSQFAEPGPVLNRGWLLGLNLGRQLADQNLEHVHFISHSAGSGLIGLAAATLRELSPATTIHTTFLDPWAGVFPLYSYETLYGGFADWSDQYYAQDDTGPWTALVGLPNSHNVDVTGLDPDFVAPLSSHAWPRCFYAHSVDGGLLDDCSAPNPPLYGLYGFPLSFEWQGESWETVIQGFPVGANVVLPTTALLANASDPRIEQTFAVRVDDVIDASGAPHIVSGEVAFIGGGFTATAQSGQDPAWITFEVQNTIPVNFISFEATFSSAAGAEGLLTVYADDTEIGALDEAFAPAGTNVYRLATDGALDPGAHRFAFRLDEFAGIQSAIDLADIATGSADFILASAGGTVAGEHAGWSIANAGDVDQDGSDDLVIGAPYNSENGNNAGKAYVLSTRTGELLFDVLGTGGSRLGWSVAGAGDVNADGYADVIVGAPYDDNKRGRAAVYSGLDGQELFDAIGAGGGDRLGYAVSGGVDFDDDGRDDVVIGAPWNDEGPKNAGQVQILSGSDGSTIGVLVGERKGDLFGKAVAALRKVDGDGFGDLVVGAPLNDDTGKNAGKVYVYSGRFLDLLYTHTGMQAGDQFGLAVAAAGRVDADARDDFVVGAPYFDRSGQSNAGRAYVYSGDGGALLWGKNGQQANDRYGWAVAGAGDVNGDGHDDVLIGAYLNDATGENAGRAYVRSGLNGSGLATFNGESANDRLGQSVAGIGDVNDDGFADVAVAAPKNDAGAEDAGRVNVFLSSFGPGMAGAAAYAGDDDDAPSLDADGGVAPTEAVTPLTGAAALQAVLEHWGPCASPGTDCPGDLNGDGVVDTLDLRAALALLTETPDDGAAEIADDRLAEEPVGIIFVNDGILAPAEYGGVFTVSDDYAQTDEGMLAIEIVGPLPIEQHDMLVVADQAWLAGALTVIIGDGFDPSPGDTFTIVAAGSVDGAFETVDMPQKWRDGAVVLVYEDTAVRLCIEAADYPGCAAGPLANPAVSADLDDDGFVEVGDLFAMLRAWGERAGRADLNLDGAVDGLDLLVLLQQWDG